MSPELYSVGEVAERLGLHVRTVRNYVRDGRLKATRIGKQYRIAREDLEAFTGRPVGLSLRDSVRRQRHVEVSSIVGIDAVSPEDAGRISNGLVAATGGGREDRSRLHVETIYDEQRARLKIILNGSVATTAGFLHLVQLYTEER
jgi:excisionase family DNA binding protein